MAWNNEINNKFNGIKQYLCNKAILRSPNFNLPYIVTIDASVDGLGGLFTQKDEDAEFVIAYASRINYDYERKHNSYELEGCALLLALKKWRCYPLGKKFTRVTGNRALAYIR